MSNPKMKPYYEHDCTECEYLGSSVSPGKPIDWYLHKDVVIGRHSSKGSDYSALGLEHYKSNDFTVGYEGRRPVDGMHLIGRYMLEKNGKLNDDIPLKDFLGTPRERDPK